MLSAWPSNIAKRFKPQSVEYAKARCRLAEWRASWEAVRNRQVKNFLALELLAAGTPMLLMGDEVRRTQRGNNNAYCHDSDISWFDWSLLERHRDIHRFVKELNAFRQRRDVVEGKALSLNQLLNQAHIEWHGVTLKDPDWSNHSHSLAFTLRSLRARFLSMGCSTLIGNR